MKSKILMVLVSLISIAIIGGCHHRNDAEGKNFHFTDEYWRNNLKYYLLKDQDGICYEEADSSLPIIERIPCPEWK